MAWLVQLALLFRLVLPRRFPFPFFFAYLLFHVIYFPFMLLQFNRVLTFHSASYRIFYSATELIGILLGLGCAYEVFSKVLNDYAAVRHFKSSILRWGGALLLISAAIIALQMPARPDSGIAGLTIQLERILRIVQSGLMLLLLGFSRYLGMEWKRPVFGIALGFGLYATVKLVVLTVALQSSAAVTSSLSVVHSISYLTTTLIWLTFLLGPQPAASPGVPLPSTEIAQWSQTMKEMSQ